MPCKSVCDENGSMNEATVEHWKISLPDLLQAYENIQHHERRTMPQWKRKKTCFVATLMAVRS
jgi:hypothetical protein